MFENKKITKIADETATYFLNRDAFKVETLIEKTAEFTTIVVEAYGAVIEEEELIGLTKILNQKHREREMEEYYWTLAGEGQESEELALVAVMVDEAHIRRGIGKIRIELKRVN